MIPKREKRPLSKLNSTGTLINVSSMNLHMNELSSFVWILNGKRNETDTLSQLFANLIS